MHIIKIINSTILDLLCFANNYTTNVSVNR